MPFFSKQILPALLWASCVLLSACGGGGGGSSSGTPSGGTSVPDNSSRGIGLSFSPSVVELNGSASNLKYFDVTATAAKTVSQNFNVAIVDKAGVISSNIGLGYISSTSYVVGFTLNPALAAGTYSGTIEVRLCYDDPKICAQPVDGSPWQLPYKITLQAPAAPHFARWEGLNMPSTSSSYSRLGVIGNNAILVEFNPYTNAIMTSTSPDGTNWKALNVAGPSLATSGFALAGDGNAIYYSAGRTNGRDGATATLTSQVWKFDGNSWQLKTAAAAFPARERHMMVKVGTRLYVIGGNAGALTDIWKSDDDGVTWGKAADSIPSTYGAPSCVVNWQNSLLVLGSSVITSSDGVNWTKLPNLFNNGYPWGSTQCAVMDGRLYVAQSTSTTSYNTVSTADLNAWQFEAEKYWGDGDSNLISVNGRLMVLANTGTSTPKIFRTVP